MDTMTWKDFFDAMEKRAAPKVGVFPTDDRARPAAAYLSWRDGAPILRSPLPGCLVLAVENGPGPRALAANGYDVAALSSGPCRLPWEPEAPPAPDPDPWGHGDEAERLLRLLRQIGASKIEIDLTR